MKSTCPFRVGPSHDIGSGLATLELDRWAKLKFIVPGGLEVTDYVPELGHGMLCWSGQVSSNHFTDKCNIVPEWGKC